MLIRDGQAKLTLGAADILSEYDSIAIVTENPIGKNTPRFNDSMEESIYELLRNESLDASSIGEKLSMDIAIVACKLSIMEVQGAIEMTIDGSYKAR